MLPRVIGRRDVILVRKLGLPGREELAIGAIASGGIRVLNNDIVRMLSIPDRVIEFVIRREVQELQRREKLYRGPQVGRLNRFME